MHRWPWATASAVVAGFGAVLLDLGPVVWRTLGSAGILTVTCHDVFGDPTMAPACAPPTSFPLVVAATVVAVALLAGFVGYRAAERRSVAARRRSP